MISADVMDRVRSLLSERGISQSSFARKIDVSPQTLSAWLSGRNRPGIDEVAKMCEVLHVSPSWIMTGRMDAPDHQSLVCTDNISIPLLDLSASCGNGRQIEDAAYVRLIQVNNQWVRRHCGDANPRALNILSVDGDSMSPTLDDGDFVIVDTSATSIYTDSVFAFLLDSDLYVKRLQRIGRKLKVISDNKLYESYILEPADLEHGFRVIGRVVTTCLVRKA